MYFKQIDMDRYKRKAHFEYFKSLAYPYVGVTVNTDITKLLKVIKSEKLPFFLTFCYCVSRAGNRIPEFRQRISGDGIIEYINCPTTHTVALDDGTYCYCDLTSELPFDEYIIYAADEQEKAKASPSLDESPESVIDKFFISSVPWLSYTALINPVPMPADSNPRITWGRYFTDGEKTLLPLSVLCNHALVDGLHIADFYRLLDNEMNEIVKHYTLDL